jgi:hypothetical protein
MPGPMQSQGEKLQVQGIAAQNVKQQNRGRPENVLYQAFHRDDGISSTGTLALA